MHSRGLSLFGLVGLFALLGAGSTAALAAATHGVVDVAALFRPRRSSNPMIARSP